VISIIVRFKNEATYLAAVLQSVRAQHFCERVEVIAVDNVSEDGSRRIAADYADVMLDIDDYRPGAALNKAIEACSGSSVVIVSAHAIPANDMWLANLTSWLGNPATLGTYGGQVYPVTSRFLDKRDLDIFSSLRPRTERRDSDFWNANSVFHRSNWEKEPFDEGVFEMEDHYWTKRHLAHGDQWVRFEPSALVYHYGHDKRNDRTFLPPSPLSDGERIENAIGILDSADESWPAVMSAGLTLSSLSQVPEVARAVPALGHALGTHPDFDVRWRLAGALGRIRDDRCADYLAGALTDPSFYTRDEAAWSLGRLGPMALPAVRRALNGLSLECQPFAALALGLTGDMDASHEAINILRRCIEQGDAQVRRDAIYFLGEVATAPEAGSLASMVEQHLAAADDELARATAWCWGTLSMFHPGKISTSTSEVVDLLRHHPVETVRHEAAVALGKLAGALGDTTLIHHLRQALNQDGNGRVRYAAMQSLRLLAAQGMPIDGPLSHDSDTDFGVRFEQHLLRQQIGTR
jgi:hypothetical protein